MYGQNIRLFRKQKGMNQHELGAAMDVSAVSVSKWEREQTQPDIETLQSSLICLIRRLMSSAAVRPSRRTRWTT